MIGSSTAAKGGTGFVRVTVQLLQGRLISSVNVEPRVATRWECLMILLDLADVSFDHRLFHELVTGEHDRVCRLRRAHQDTTRLLDKLFVLQAQLTGLAADCKVQCHWTVKYAIRKIIVIDTMPLASEHHEHSLI